jgi:hypothetical protein
LTPSTASREVTSISPRPSVLDTGYFGPPYFTLLVERRGDVTASLGGEKGSGEACTRVGESVAARRENWRAGVRMAV